MLILLASFCLWAALATHAAVERSELSNAQSDAYDSARYWVAVEDILEWEFHDEPGSEVRAEHAAAADTVVRALLDVRDRGLSSRKRLGSALSGV